tara:strand:+ start:29 stop:412 length:384 start_codon:yes stop_codon:yes gene_type:complete
MSKVVNFPSDKIVNLEKTLSKSDRETLKDNKQQYLDKVNEQITIGILNSMAMVGLNIFDKKFGEDLFMIMEQIKAMMYRNAKLNHSLQDLLSDMFQNKTKYFGENELIKIEDDFEKYILNEETDLSS